LLIFLSGPRAEMSSAMGDNYLVADLGLKYRIIVARLRPQADREA
jgi:hypothetical protein